MSHIFKLILVIKGIFTYLLSGAVLITYHSITGVEGHAHIPFSSFPSNLIFSPFAPAFLLDGDIDYFLVYFSAIILITLAFIVHHKLRGNRGA